MKNLALLILIISAFIQCKAPKKTLDVAAAKEYSKVIDREELKEKLYTIASDEFEGRDTGEPGQKKAAAYLKDFYMENNIGAPSFTNKYFQHIPASFFDDKMNASENVIAVIEGSEFPDEIVVVSAHYDHLGIADNGEVYNGADDDGSGTVAVMQMAKAF
ncbi:MAG TPA: M28 family peptidase, partial [Flavobacteriaceae bacterium]|nr:M28 family peptidase [Flavobacteriaceae bacterium]